MMIKEFNEPLISEIIIGVARRSMCKISSIQVWSALFEGLGTRLGVQMIIGGSACPSLDIASRIVTNSRLPFIQIGNIVNNMYE